MRRFHPETVTVLAGPDGNGGGGLVAARHLANPGVTVEVSQAEAARTWRRSPHSNSTFSSARDQRHRTARPAALVIGALLG